MLIISVGKDRIKLSITPLSQILPHERTIQSLSNKILQDMKRTGFQRDPILIDQKTKLALDGMHRLRALKTIGSKYALCADFPYSDRDVKLERWIRTIIGPGHTILSKIRSKLSMEALGSIQDAIQKVDTRDRGVALLTGQACYYGGDKLDHLELYKAIRQIDLLCERNRIELEFIPESEKLDLYSSSAVATIYPARLSKSEILQFAKRKNLLPYKTTRHVVPLRPMGVYFPLQLLKNGSFLDCNKELERIVKFSKVMIERKNLWYEGRRYTERIAVFRPTRWLRESENHR